MGKLAYLYLYGNQIGDDSMVAFSAAISSGSLRALESLDLSSNQIGDVGMIEFSRSIPIGSMGALEKLDLSFNMISDVGMTELSRSVANGSLGCPGAYTFYSKLFFSSACKHCKKPKEDHQPRSGSLRALTHLDLHYNQIGDLGMIEFSRSIAIGSMVKLNVLGLACNQIGDIGMIEFSHAIANGSMGELRYLYLPSKQPNWRLRHGRILRGPRQWVIACFAKSCCRQQARAPPPTCGSMPASWNLP